MVVDEVEVVVQAVLTAIDTVSEIRATCHKRKETRIRRCPSVSVRDFLVPTSCGPAYSSSCLTFYLLLPSIHALAADTHHIKFYIL